MVLQQRRKFRPVQTVYTLVQTLNQTRKKEKDSEDNEEKRLVDNSKMTEARNSPFELSRQESPHLETSDLEIGYLLANDSKMC